MTEGRINVTSLARYREQRKPAASEARWQERSESRAKETYELLEKVRGKKRLSEGDRALLATNLGRLVAKLALEKPEALAKQLLGSEYQKRKRYLLFPGEHLSEKGFYAASGPRFARIIEQLSDTAARQGSSRPETLNETVRKALKGTSFRTGSDFRMPEHAGDLAHLCGPMERCLNELAEVTDLADYFDRVSKYPIWPRDVLAREEAPLKLDGRIVNELLRDILVEDDDMPADFPWWTPKCVIGYLYVPFECNVLSCRHLSEADLKAVAEECENPEHFDQDLFDRMLSSGSIEPGTVYYRLPVWIAVLPSRSGVLAACLYASVAWYCDVFDWKATDHPRFVSHIGSSFKDDVVHNFDIFESEFSVGRREYKIPGHLSVIGPRIECEANHEWGLPSLANDDDFEIATNSQFDLPSDLPEWLNGDPVERLIPISD